MNGKIRVTESEWIVMEPLWDHSPQSAQEVIRALEEDQDWSPKTVKTLLGRLVKKKALSFEKLANRYLYSPAITREDAVREEAESFLSRICRNSLLPLIAHSIETDRQLDDDEIEALRELLAKQKGGKK